MSRPYDQIKEALEKAAERHGLPCRVNRGSKHIQFVLAERIVAVMPSHGKCGESTAHRRRTLNALKRIERTARELAGEGRVTA